ncbi:MAG: hypothetical protein ABH865_02615 [Candidatus Omnitrophota bacterium]|nr:hypothetical protein [Candidatus Omnitrophota bacterium]
MRKFFLFVIVAAISISVFADIKVYLKNGRRMTGALVSMDEKKITIALPGRGTMRTSFPKEDVESIEGLSYDEFARAKKTHDALTFEGKEQGFKSSFSDAIKLVEEKRALPFILDVNHEILERDQLQDYLRKEMDRSISDEDIERERKLLIQLGLLSADTDYKEMTINLFTRSVAGLYDPREKKMYLLKDATSRVSPIMPSEVIMHELVHALQDQYLFLDQIDEELKTLDMDQTLARRAVIEGEATFVSYSIVGDYVKKIYGQKMPKNALAMLDMEKFIFESMQLMTNSLSDDFTKKPLLEYMIFPYVRGGTFMKYAFDNGGWAAVDKIYKDYPVSSEQVIHPEKYFLVKDEPLPLAEKKLAFLQAAGFQCVDRGVLGEFTLYAMAQTFLDGLYAKMISEGWGNDRYYLFEKESKNIFIMDTLWDSSQDTEEFYKGIKALFDKKYKGLAWTEHKDFFVGHNEIDTVYGGKKGAEVVTIESKINDTELISELVSAFAFPWTASGPEDLREKPARSESAPSGK